MLGNNPAMCWGNNPAMCNCIDLLLQLHILVIAFTCYCYCIYLLLQPRKFCATAFTCYLLNRYFPLTQRLGEQPRNVHDDDRGSDDDYGGDGDDEDDAGHDCDEMKFNKNPKFATKARYGDAAMR